MKVTVKNIKGEKKDIEVQPEDKISTLQQQVEIQHGVPVESQRLILKGKNLDPEKTIQEVGMLEGDTLILMVLKNAVLKKKEEVQEPQQPVQPVPQSTPNTEPQAQTPTNNPAQIIPQDLMPTEAQKEQSIKDLMDMGFPRDMVIQCLEVAGYNQEAAVQYLLNGIPESVLNDQIDSNVDYSQNGSQEIQLTQEQMVALQQLQQSAEFQQIRDQVVNNPQMLSLFLNTLQTQSPQLFQLFQSNPNLLIALFQGDLQTQQVEGHTEQAHDNHNQQGQIQINLTQMEMKDIEEMQQLGFSKEECVEAYMVCDKNKEQAINFLLDGKFNQK